MFGDYDYGDMCVCWHSFHDHAYCDFQRRRDPNHEPCNNWHECSNCDCKMWRP